MYIGRLGDGSNPDDGNLRSCKGSNRQLRGWNFIMGAGNKIIVTIAGDTVRVRDYGRGIPLGKVIECVSIINTGAKYNDDVFQFSVGLNGRGNQSGERAFQEFPRCLVQGRQNSSSRNSKRECSNPPAKTVPGREKKTGFLVEFFPPIRKFSQKFSFQYGVPRKAHVELRLPQLRAHDRAQRERIQG